MQEVVSRLQGVRAALEARAAAQRAAQQQLEAQVCITYPHACFPEASLHNNALQLCLFGLRQLRALALR